MGRAILRGSLWMKSRYNKIKENGGEKKSSGIDKILLDYTGVFCHLCKRQQIALRTSNLPAYEKIIPLFGLDCSLSKSILLY